MASAIRPARYCPIPPTLDRSHRLRHHHQRRVAADRAQRRDLARHLIEAIRDFRQQNDVGAAGNAGMERDVAGVAAHDLQHHDPGVACGRRLQPIERLGRDRNRRVEPD